MESRYSKLSKRDYCAILDLLSQQHPKLVKDTIESYQKNKKPTLVTYFELDDVSFYFDLTPRYVELLKERLKQKEIFIEGDKTNNASTALDFFHGEIIITKDNVHYDEPVDEDELDFPSKLAVEVQKRLQEILDGKRRW